MKGSLIVGIVFTMLPLLTGQKSAKNAKVLTVSAIPGSSLGGLCVTEPVRRGKGGAIVLAGIKSGRWAGDHDEECSGHSGTWSGRADLN